MPHAKSESPVSDYGASYGIIKDIGGSKVTNQTCLKIRQYFVLPKVSGKRPSLPEELLYDDNGLETWSKLIYHPEYYQTRDEIELLKTNGAEIASYLQPNTSLIDLGAGDTRKVMHFLDILENISLPCEYYALDISRSSVSYNIDRFIDRYKHIQTTGLWGTFSDLSTWLDSNAQGPRLFLSLGSVLFNDSWEKAVANLRVWAETMGRDDMILAGMDGHSMPDDGDKIWASYHGRGSAPLWDSFWINGFKHANSVLGEPLFKRDDWKVLGYVSDYPVSHQFVFQAKRDINMDKLGIKFKRGEEWDWFDAHKYGVADVKRMCREVGLEVLKVWQIEGSRMYQYLIRRERALL